ncbi:MAG: Xaa-Pro peptidase family protein [Chloroflexota bacterium]|nr:Xaa-Pro peptidase family protein [Chloroflexota bacterium]
MGKTAAAMIAPIETLAITRGEYEGRIAATRRAMERDGLDALILFNSIRIVYLTGFTHATTERPMALIIPASGDLGVLIPALEQEHVRKSTGVGHFAVYPEYPAGPSGKHPMQHLAALLKELKLSGTGKKIGVDADGYGDVNGYRGPSVTAIADGASVVQAADLIDTSRQVKTAHELQLIRESARWGNLAHRVLQKEMAVGRSEIEVSLRATLAATTTMLDTLGPTYIGGGRGVQSSPASAMFIAGTNTSMPHGMRREGGLRPGDVIITGAGALVGGYHSELERTMIVGEPSPEFRKYFEAMAHIQEVAFAALRPGRTCADAERDISGAIAAMGHAALQRHHTGHGIGLEGHEQPFIDMGDETELKPGMVLSVEPGLYVPGFAGFRHSDTVVITETGCDALTFYPRDLDSLIVPV